AERRTAGEVHEGRSSHACDGRAGGHVLRRANVHRRDSQLAVKRFGEIGGVGRGPGSVRLRPGERKDDVTSGRVDVERRVYGSNVETQIAGGADERGDGAV